MADSALLLPGLAKEAALLAPLAGRIYDHAPQENAFPIATLANGSGFQEAENVDSSSLPFH